MSAGGSPDHRTSRFLCGGDITGAAFILLGVLFVSATLLAFLMRKKTA